MIKHCDFLKKGNEKLRITDTKLDNEVLTQKSIFTTTKTNYKDHHNINHHHHQIQQPSFYGHYTPAPSLKNRLSLLEQFYCLNAPADGQLS